MSDAMSSISRLVADGPVLVDLHDDGIIQIRLNRPEAANGLDLGLLEAFCRAITICQGDSRVRVVLLSGEGKHFCAGGDVKAFASQGEALPGYLRVATSHLHAVAGGLMHLDAPVVTAVQGYAAGGGGLGLVCSSDFVLAGESARFMAGATRVAMVPDAGVSVTLARLVGFRRATEILMLNAELGAAQALEIGLVNRVVPDADLMIAAFDLARRLAAGAPLALAATKRLLWSGLSIGADASMPEESRTQSELGRTADVMEGLRAVIEHRAPRFAGR